MLDPSSLQRWGRRRRNTPGVLIVELDDERALEMEEAFESRRFHAQSVSSIETAEMAAWGNRFDAVIISCGADADSLQPFIAWLRREYGEVRGPLMVAVVDARDDASVVAAGAISPVLIVKRSEEVARLVDAVRRRLGTRERSPG